MTARKPDNFPVRSRGASRTDTPARRTVAGPGQGKTADVSQAGTSRLLKDSEVCENVRKDSSAANADDSIAARLDRWESLDEKLRSEQSVQGKIGLFNMSYNHFSYRL